MDSSSLLEWAICLASEPNIVEHEPLDLEEELAPHILAHTVVFLPTFISWAILALLYLLQHI